MRRSLLHVIVLVALCVVAVQARGQTSPHGKLSIACEDCHTSSSWQVLSSPMKFDHKTTKFPLSGQHEQVACKQCHTNLVFASSASRCTDCHKDVHRGELGANCERCHGPQTWLVPDMPQRHAQTRFALVGRHMTAPCRACHVNEQKYEYVAVPTDCYSCHRVQYEATTSPAHRAVGFGTNCETCHAITAIRFEGTFDHNTTGFVLVGAHAAQPCAACHTGNRFTNTSTQCSSCHQKDFTAAVNPKHTGFSTDCMSCHTITAWQPAKFDHSKTVFPLTGAHVSVPCASCHTTGQFASTPTQCIGCHQADFTNAPNPKHTGFSTDCRTCHTVTAWQPATFDHSKSAFPLTGAHQTVPCASCHTNGQFASTPTQCIGCHQADFTNAPNPKHTGFSTDCTTCHTVTAWQPATFDHSKSVFPLTGAHASVPCASCHANGQFATAPTQCIGCHQADFSNAPNPKHTGFPTDCTTCHNVTAWQPSTFDHSKTVFPLTGAHVSVACISCHTTSTFASTPTQCYSCHQVDFSKAANPPHTGFSTDCTTCHNVTAWQPATFDHSKTVFPLTGAHAAVPCASCHKNNVFAGTPTQCYSCHQADFTGANAPPHAGFSTDCTTCHNVTAWQPATFDHSKTTFPLTGAHTTVACASCHTNNNYTTVSTTCYTCHSSTFASATTPVPHTGFATDCATCHTTNAGWMPSTYSHANAVPRFPQDNRHKNAACTKCHQNATNYTIACCQSSGCHNNCAGGGD